MSELYGSDAYAPLEVARRVETVGVAAPAGDGATTRTTEIPLNAEYAEVTQRNT